MGIRHGSTWCGYCNRQVQATRDTPNHVLHLLISLFCCGWWVPVWLVLIVLSLQQGWRCSVCGQMGHGDSTDKGMGKALLVTAGLVTAGLVLTAVAVVGWLVMFLWWLGG